MTFVNPLAHVAAPAPEEELIVRLGGKDIKVRPLDTGAIAYLANRFPAMQAQLNGEQVNIEGVEAAEFACVVIALAVAPESVTMDQLDIVVASTAGLKPLERDLAMAVIMNATMPDFAEAGPDFPAAPTKAATAGASKKPTRRKAPAAK